MGFKVSSDYEIAMKQGQEDVQQYFAYCVQLEEQLEKQKSGDKTDDRKFINKGITLDSMQENDTIVGSVAGKIKSAALQLYPNYKKSNANEKIIVCLGLNSCLDLSYQYPNGQSILFTASEWRALRNRFPKPSYPTNVYDDAVDIVRSAIAYDNKKSSRFNWTKMYKRIKKLEDQYDVELNEEHNDAGFALFFFSQLLKLINNNPELFDEQKEVSEQDFSVKFWSSILERLFVKSGLTLKWGEIDMDSFDSFSLSNFEKAQRCHDPGIVKVHSDRCCSLMENKIAIDSDISSGCGLKSFDSLQVSGPDFYILNLTMVGPGLYASNQVLHVRVDNSLTSLQSYIHLIVNLMRFKDEVITKRSYQSDH